MKQEELFSYVYDFVSGIIEKKIIFSSIKNIILFGSVARGNFDDKSDVDLFIELKYIKEQKKIKAIVEKELNKFETRCGKTWYMRGISLPIKIITGSLDEERWHDLREEIVSYGKIIYGNYEKVPEGLTHHILITYELKKLTQKNKMALLRTLFGYTSKKMKKEYKHKGLFESAKVSSNTILIPVIKIKDVKKVLRKQHVTYKIKDVWVK